jgi:DNA polymerase III delta subunit
MSIILYHGTDAWRLRRASADAGAGWETMGEITRVHGTDTDALDQVERILKYPSFFAARALVVIDEPLDMPDLPALLEHSSGTDETDILLVQRMPERPSAARKQALKALERHVDRTEVFSALSGTSLAEWIRSFCGERGCSIEPAAVAELTARAGDDSWVLANELEKLCAYGAPAITIAAVRSLVPAPATEDEWELANALAAHDKRRAVSALFRRLHDGTPEQLLLGSIASSVRSLLMVRDLAGRGNAAGAIAAATGLHPYVVSKTLRGAAAYDTARLTRAHRMLAALDLQAKNGQADAADGLFAVLLAL